VISPCTSPLAPTDLGAGEHSLTVTASNIAGSDSATRSFTVLAEPTLSITSPTEDEEEVGSPVSPTFTLGGGAPTTVTCQFDSEPVVDPCTSPLDPVELEPGEHTITVTATNVGGTATVTRDFTVVEPPKVSITAPSNVQVVGSPATATFTIEGGTPNDVSCQWDDEPVITPCASPQGPKALSPGSHTFTVTATNAAEVVSVTSKFSIAANVQAAAVEGPVVRESTNLQLDSGDVFVKVPGSDAFVKLTKDMLVPIGTLIDATDGKAHITLANKDKSLYDGIFWGGVFEVKQGTGDNPIATMKLRPGFGVQGATANAAHAMISGHSTAELERGFKVWTSRRRGKKKGGVWGDAHGKFRTSGSGGSATVNGTRWYVANYENGSLFKVSRGVVTVKPLHCPAFKLTAGHSEFLYLENSKKHKKKRKHPLKRKCASE
jgi:PKD repeat protein